MAAVLDALASNVMELIAGMAEEEVSMLLGISGEITKLEDNMESIRAFLADAERRRITDESVQRWVRKLKNAMYDATDILDLCQLEADKRREPMGGSLWKEKVPGCFQPLRFCLRSPVFAHEIGSRIKELNQRLDEIYKESDRFKFNINLGSYQGPRKLTSTKYSSLKTMSEFDETAIVGEKIERDTKELIQELITNVNSDIKVVSIVGMGGMGKTTLAQKIFKERTIEEHFKMRIWLSITQQFDEAELLRVAINQADGVHVGKQDKTLLMKILTNCLSTGRFLLVMDDVWSDEAWNHLLRVPVKNASHKQPGNSVIITTRVEDMARRMGCSYYQHYLAPLSQEDSWSLLMKQLPLNEAVRIDTLKDVGMKIIRRCEGLPLAIKVIGGLLSTKETTQMAWEAVLNDSKWSLYGLPAELNNLIYLSYEDLSPQLKQCFLYCSLFPKGMTIQQSELIPMWISEGFIQPRYGSSSQYDQLEEIALEYYLELMKRNLIEPAYESSVTGYQCVLRDVVRSFAEFMAREESFVVQDERTAGSVSHSLVRRLSIGSNISVPEWHILVKHRSVRTLIINCRTNIKPGDFFSSLPSLRVLFIRGADCDRLVDSLYVLRHLRYLHLNGTDITRLPDDIHRMKFLQHIVLTGSGNLENLPSSITKLVHLRTLDISGSNINVIPKGFGMLANLRSLYGFPVHMDMDGDSGWCSLQEIGPLSQLRDFTLHGLENVPASFFAEKGMVSSKMHLNYLELRWSSRVSIGSRDEFEKQITEEEVFEKISAPSCIQHLWIEGYIGRCLPNWMMLPAGFKSLRYLALIDLPCCRKLSDHLCQLPCLELLQIDNAPVIRRIGPEFQASSQTTVGGVAALSVAFCKLANLYLSNLCEWEEWDWEEHGNDVSTDTMAMPALKILTIQNCKLSCLPPGLASSKRHALRNLNLCGLTTIASIENFHSVVKLDVISCPKLKRISGLSRLHTIRIICCPNLEVLEGVPYLDSLTLEDANMETLPGYLGAVHPRFLKLACGEELYNALFPGSSEWNKISHIEHMQSVRLVEKSVDSIVLREEKKLVDSGCTTGDYR